MMNVWQPIDTAPKDRPIVVWCDPDADPGSYDGGRTLTTYANHMEGTGNSHHHGLAIAVWGGAYSESDWEHGYEWNIPDWWFKEDSDFESPLNPIAWADIAEFKGF